MRETEIRLAPVCSWILQLSTLHVVVNKPKKSYVIQKIFACDLIATR